MEKLFWNLLLDLLVLLAATGYGLTTLYQLAAHGQATPFVFQTTALLWLILIGSKASQAERNTRPESE